VELVPQRENLELQRRSRAHERWRSLKDRKEDGEHRQQAYPRMAATSIASITTRF
jgi:hypothetical protein